MIEVKKAWVDEGNFVGYAVLGSSLESGIFVARGSSANLLHGAAEVAFELTADGLRDSAATKRLEEFAGDVDGLVAGDPAVLQKYVAPQAGRTPSNTYQALGKGCMAGFLFGYCTTMGPNHPTITDFRVPFMKEYAPVEVSLAHSVAS